MKQRYFKDSCAKSGEMQLMLPRVVEKAREQLQSDDLQELDQLLAPVQQQLKKLLSLLRPHVCSAAWVKGCAV